MLPNEEVKVAPQTPKALNLSKSQLAELPLEELKRLAIAESRAAQEAQETPASIGRRNAEIEAHRQSANARAEREAAKAEVSEDEGEVFVAERTIDLGVEGAGAETFRGEGVTKEAALEDLLDKIAEGKRNATLKIRQQQQIIAAHEARQGRLDADNQYVVSQMLQQGDPRGLDLLLKSQGVSLEEVVSTAKAHNAFKQQQNNNAEVNAFLASHENYEDQGEAGVKNGAIMRDRLRSLGLSLSAANLHVAYEQLRDEGLLQTNSSAEPVSPQRQQPAEQPKPTRKSSGITSQNSNRTSPRPAVTEDDAYRMDINELRARANQQLKSEAGETTSGVEGYVQGRQTGLMSDRVR